MDASNKNLRNALRDYPFYQMLDPVTEPGKFVNSKQLSIIYLGGYDHLTQSTIASIVLSSLFEHRISMKNDIPSFLTIVEEARNFIPSKSEGQADTPSVDIIRKVMAEGRKFGVGLLLVSQKPNRLDQTTLSQCNTFLIFRLVNPNDQWFVKMVLENLSEADGRLLLGFGPGEGIISGQAVRFPLIVRVELDKDLEADALGSENFVEIVKDWENSPQSNLIKEAEEFGNNMDEI